MTSSTASSLAAAGRSAPSGACGSTGRATRSWSNGDAERVEPGEVRPSARHGRATGVEPLGAQRGVLPTQQQQPAGGREQVRAPRRQRPTGPRRSRCPGSTRCCCPLRAAHLVAGRDHRRARGEHQGGEQVADRAAAQAARCRPRGSPGATWPSIPWFHDRLSSLPVAVVLAVGRVVLVVVGDQVGQREAVVRGDVVDRRDRAADQRRVAVPEQVDGPGQAGGQVADAVAGQTVRGAAGVGEPERAGRRCGSGRSTRRTAPGTARCAIRRGRRPTAPRRA